MMRRLTQRNMPIARGAGSAWPWWIATATYFTTSCLMHLQFSLWLVRPREMPWGRHALSELMPMATVFGALLLAAFAVWQLRRCPRPWLLGGLWLLWVPAVLGVDRWLTFSANEHFHYPQYAVLAWLIARTLDPDR